VLVLSKQDMQSVFSMAEAVKAIKNAFRLFSEGKTIAPLRTKINVAKHDGMALFMPAYVEETESLGLKIVSVFPLNPNVGKPAVPSTMIFMDNTSGEVSAIMDGTYLTQIRTGAAAGAATDLLARKDSAVGAIIGAGGQLSSQLEAMLTVRKMKEVRIYDAVEGRANKAVEIESEKWKLYDVRIVAAISAEEAVTGADIITTVTTAKKPVFHEEAVKKGAHVNGVGSYMPVMQEIPPEIFLKASRVFVDSRDAVLSEAGDLIIPINEGRFTKEIISGELGELVVGRAAGRENDKDITVFKTVGIGVQDVITASEIFLRAKRNNVGTEISF